MIQNPTPKKRMFGSVSNAQKVSLAQLWDTFSASEGRGIGNPAGICGTGAFRSSRYSVSNGGHSRIAVSADADSRGVIRLRQINGMARVHVGFVLKKEFFTIIVIILAIPAIP